MMYRVVTTNQFILDQAAEIRKNYGLTNYFETSQIVEVWATYSSMNGVPWLEPVKELIEDAFNIVLEEAGVGSVVSMSTT